MTPTLLFGAGVTPASAAGAVSSVTGGASGYQTSAITIFGGPQNAVARTPSVVLTPTASNSPQSASATTGLVQYGPATLFTSDGSTVQTAGSLGPSGSVTSKSTVNHVNKATTQSSTGSEPLTATAIAGSCTASSSGSSGSTTITGGTLTTDNGIPGSHPPVTVAVPANPAPSTSITGVVYLSATSHDSFHFVFNEQSTSGGVRTVNPVHEYFDGPTLRGNLIIGQVVCGVTVSAATASPGTTRSAAVPSPSPVIATPSPTARTSSASSTTSSQSTTTTSQSTTTSGGSSITAAAAADGGGGGRTGAVIAGVAGALLVGALVTLWMRRRRVSQTRA